MDSAVIFDVDGVLLELTRDEEELFFTALSKFVPTEQLSRDWNSYRTRNDDDIIAEILERNGRPTRLRGEVRAHYLDLLGNALASRRVESRIIPGADELLRGLQGRRALGIATANLLGAAQLRLEQAGLWQFVAHNAQGADGGGHKREILARLIARLPLPKTRIVYVGDNLNDVEAGLANGVQFIGFSADPARREILAKAGAFQVCGNHLETTGVIERLLT
jgi:phosphoglycolate phosphatase-like HAD superfamily hydrolase